MIRQWRKSATWPSVSVSRPSSNTCRNRSQTRGWASRTRPAARPRRVACAPDEKGLRFSMKTTADKIGKIGGLKFAHVQPKEPIDRAEQILGRGLRKLGLSGPGRPGEEQYADRPARIIQAGLEHGNAIDDALDGLVLAHDAAREEAAHRLEVNALLVVENGWGQARELRQCMEDILGLQLGFLVPAGSRELDEVKRRSRQSDRTEILPCAGDSGFGASGAGGQAVRQALEQRARQQERGFFGLGLKPHDLQDAAEHGPDLKKPCGGSGARLGPHHQSPRQHRRKKLIKDTCALSLMRSAARELQKVR